MMKTNSKQLVKPKERNRAFGLIRRQFEKKIHDLEWEVLEALRPQIKKRINQRKKGINKSALSVPQALFNKHKRLVYNLLSLTSKQASQFAKTNIKNYKKLNKTFIGKIKELEMPDDQLLKAAYAERSVDYSKWVTRKIRIWTGDVSKLRFRSTINKAKSVIIESTKQGWTWEETQKQLKKKFKKYNTYQLDRVITTEQTRMIAISEFAEYQDNEFIVGYEWKVNYTGCPICDAKASEGFIPKNEVDAVGLPPAHPNCECTLEPVFVTEPIAVDYILSSQNEFFAPYRRYLKSA